jgi:hypothetical protein
MNGEAVLNERRTRLRADATSHAARLKALAILHEGMPSAFAREASRVGVTADGSLE